MALAAMIVGVLLAALVLAPKLLPFRAGNAAVPELVTTTAWKGPYDFTVTGRGTVSSGSSTELICEVRSGGPATILEVLPEGTWVNAGDVVVRLDTSVLEDLESQQKILISTRESLLAQAENTLKAAEIGKKEYEEGLFVSQEQLLESELFIAERAKTAAETALESTKALYEKAIVTGPQLEIAHTALADATNKLDSAQTNLTTLRTLTKQKELTLLQAAIASAEAIAKEHRRGLQLEMRRLKYLQEQIEKCTIYAPDAGQVVYANEPDYYRTGTNSPFVVQAGAQVRDRQVIVWLPNPADMQIKVNVSEARITLIRPGMPVSIRLDAFDDEIVEGEVTKVNLFPEPGNYYGGSVNKYSVTISIKNPPSSLRIGMTAETWIHVERDADALQVPVQALAETQGHYFSLVKNGDSFETRELEVSSINDEVATIERGLEEGDEVVISPRSAGDLLEIPEMPEATPVANDEIPRAEPAELSLVGNSVSNLGGDTTNAGDKTLKAPAGALSR